MHVASGRLTSCSGNAAGPVTVHVSHHCEDVLAYDDDETGNVDHSDGDEDDDDDHAGVDDDDDGGHDHEDEDDDGAGDGDDDDDDDDDDDCRRAEGWRQRWL